MNRTSLRLILITVVVIASLAWLILSGVKQTGLQYLSVTELAQLQAPPKSGASGWTARSRQEAGRTTRRLLASRSR
jgi:hypothetical protein